MSVYKWADLIIKAIIASALFGILIILGNISLYL